MVLPCVNVSFLLPFYSGINWKVDDLLQNLRNSKKLKLSIKMILIKLPKQLKPTEKPKGPSRLGAQNHARKRNPYR